MQAAFLLPMLTVMVNNGLTSSRFSPVQEPQAIVIAPTRELATQIYVEACKFAMGTDVKPVVVYGGTSGQHQLRQVENGANVVVGTPGRMLDFIEKGKVSESLGGNANLFYPQGEKEKLALSVSVVFSKASF